MAEAQRITLDQVEPELRKIVGRIPSPPVDKPFVRRLARLVQGMLPTPKVEGVRIEKVKHASRGMRIYHPAERRSKAALLWIHGGGYLIGHPSQNDALCGSTAKELGITVFSASYRLAPENPFPAALDDLDAAWQWLLAEATARDIDPARIAIGGESAGGGLAATLVQRLHDSGGRQPVAQWLFCPMLDDRTAARRELDARQHILWNNRLNAVGWRAYLGAEPGSAALPAHAAAARRKDLGGLPPAWIGVGDIDLFCAENRAYADRLTESGVPTTYLEAPGGPHAFYTLVAEANMSRRFMADARRWLENALTTD